MIQPDATELTQEVPFDVITFPDVQGAIAGTVTPSTDITQADTRAIVVSVACPTFTPVNCGLSLVQSPIRAGIAVVLSSSTAPVPAVLRPRIRLVFMSTSPASGRSIQFVSVPDVGVPRAGVTSVGLVALTGDHDPVAVVHTGRAEAPPPTRTSVVAPFASVC